MYARAYWWGAYCSVHDKSIAKRWHIVCRSKLLGPTTSPGSDRTNTPWGSIALPYYKGDFLLYPKERRELKGRDIQNKGEKRKRRVKRRMTRKMFWGVEK